jgi:DNA transposition AAA+ family ATPase
MTKHKGIGNNIKPLANVAALVTLVKRLEKRQFGLPGMGVFCGPTGFGKTFACASVSANSGAIHISVQKLWTKKTLLTSILRELDIAPAKTMADMAQQINEGLATVERTLIIDEADYALDRGMIEIIRDMHDGSSVPVVLVGMELLPEKLKRFELVDGRILSWQQAEPADLRDTRMLAEVYASGYDLDDGLLEHIRALHKGQVRRICTDLAHVVEYCRSINLTSMSLHEWGDQPFLRGEAPGPRGGLS